MAINQASFTLTKQERREIMRLAKDAGLTFSNYVRQCCGLEALQHGGKRKRKKEKN